MAKSKWSDIKEKLILVECWARDGLTDEQISNNLGISTTTFYEYKKNCICFFILYSGVALCREKGRGGIPL